MDEDASSDAESSTVPRQKRRKVSPTSPTRSEEAAQDLDVSVENPWLAAAFDTSAMRRAPSLPASRPLAGEQFSCYELMRRRDLGLRTRPSQGQLACLIPQRSHVSTLTPKPLYSVFEAMARNVRLEQRGRRRPDPIANGPPILGAPLRARVYEW